MWTFFFFLILTVAAIITSLVAWRQKSKALYITAWIMVGLMGLIGIANWEFAKALIVSGAILLIIFFGMLYAIPIIFLVKSKMDKPGEAFDGSTAGGAVTEEYLDEIINAPDEEIDFEEDLDLR